MAATQRSRRQKATGNNGAPVKPRRRARTTAPKASQAPIGTEEVKRLFKAPGDYVGIGRMFANALQETGFKGDVTPFRLAKMLQRAEHLAQRAATTQTAATAAQRHRMVHDSQTWKSILATWRLVSAAMPNHPELEQPFAFMQQYMSTGPREASPPPASPTA